MDFKKVIILIVIIIFFIIAVLCFNNIKQENKEEINNSRGSVDSSTSEILEYDSNYFEREVEEPYESLESQNYVSDMGI